MSKVCEKRADCKLEIVVHKLVAGELVGEPVFQGLECDLPAWSKDHPEYREPGYVAIHSDTLEMVKRGEISLEELKAQAMVRRQAEVLEYEAFVKALFEKGPFADPGEDKVSVYNPPKRDIAPKKLVLN